MDVTRTKLATALQAISEMRELTCTLEAWKELHILFLGLGNGWEGLQHGHERGRQHAKLCMRLCVDLFQFLGLCIGIWTPISQMEVGCMQDKLDSCQAR